MTPNNVISNGMGASRIDVNRDVVGTRAQPTNLKKARKNKKGKSKNKVNFGPNGPVKLVFNSFGQPIAPAKSVEKFSRFIGSIARELSMFPINVSDFRKFKGTDRVKTAWEDIKVKIDWSDPEIFVKMKRIRKTVRKLNGRWRKYKHDLYVQYYLNNIGLPERFVCSDGDVNQQQWRALVLQWDKFGEKKTETFNKNRGSIKDEVGKLEQMKILNGRELTVEVLN
ncbi:hypothetical protein M0R45_006949 [Rubus argutus]|uniref:Transposase, Ptta/En/Spm, plant n=1 Tax=Rubus argutus TaxID=59490 RepID=A0AAW1YS27_RUBAR